MADEAQELDMPVAPNPGLTNMRFNLDLSRFSNKKVLAIGEIAKGWVEHIRNGAVYDPVKAQEIIERIYAREGVVPRVYHAEDSVRAYKMNELMSFTELANYPDFMAITPRSGEKMERTSIDKCFEWRGERNRMAKGVFEEGHLDEGMIKVQAELMDLLDDVKKIFEDDFRGTVVPALSNATELTAHPELLESRDGRGRPRGGEGESSGPLSVVSYVMAAGIELTAAVNAEDLPDRQRDIVELFKLGVIEIASDAEVCILAPAPTRIEFDDEGRLHSDGGRAVEYANGEGFHFMTGVWFPDALFKEITAPDAPMKTILNLEDVDQRMAAMRFVGPERLIEEAGAKLIDKSKKGNELYMIAEKEGVFRQDAYFLKYEDPSTDRVYVSGVDPSVGSEKDADKAMAWKFHMTKDEYLDMKVQA